MPSPVSGFGLAGAQLMTGDAVALVFFACLLRCLLTRQTGAREVSLPPLLIESRRKAQLLVGHVLPLAVRGKHVRAVLGDEVFPLFIGQLSGTRAFTQGLQGGFGLADDHELILATLLGDDEVALKATADLDMKLLLHAWIIAKPATAVDPGRFRAPVRPESTGRKTV